MENNQPRKKIIGFAYVMWHGEYFAADVYEGNMVSYPDGNVDSIPDKTYQQTLEKYKELVKRDERISTAYDANKKMNRNFLFQIPASTADPEAAEKEWYLRHLPEPEPEVIPEPERKKGLFRKKAKPEKSSPAPEKKVACPSCGALQMPGKKFCSDCGAPMNAETKPQEIPAAPVTPDSDVEELVFLEEDKTEKKHGETPAKKTEKRPVKQPEPEPFDEDDEEETEGREETPAASGKRKKEKKKKGFRPIFLVLGFILLAILLAGAWFFIRFYMPEQEMVTTPPSGEAQEAEPFVAIMFTRDLAVDEVIEKDDLDGCILNEEQYEKYTNISTYINAEGESVMPELISWDDVSSVIGKRVTSDVKKGSLLYDTTITSQHVIASKTYVEATVNGEDGTYQVEGDVLPGNTKIQIVAVIATDGAEPVQVLLSEMTLQDRSLQSIFDSAGQDVLKILSGDTQEEPAEGEASEENAAEGENPEDKGEEVPE